MRQALLVLELLELRHGRARFAAARAGLERRLSRLSRRRRVAELAQRLDP